MEREGLVKPGQTVQVAEGSGNISFSDRLKSREGVVTDVVQNDKGFYVVVEFDE